MLGFALLALACSITTAADQPQDLDCVITPSALVDVSAAVPGVLEKVTVDRSAQVTAGQLLAQLDSGVEQAELELALMRVDMDAIVKLRETSLNFDQRSWKRLTSLHSSKLVSTEDKERAEREAKVSNWRLQDAKDLLRQRKLESVRAEKVLLRRQVFSPISGIVVKRMHHPGEYVEDQPIMTVAQLDPLYIESIVPMTDFGRIRKGMQAKVYAEINSDQALTARVDVVDGIGDAASGTFGVRLTLPNPEHAIPAGVKCRMHFLRERIVDKKAQKKNQELLDKKKLSSLLAKDKR